MPEVIRETGQEEFINPKNPERVLESSPVYPLQERLRFIGDRKKGEDTRRYGALTGELRLKMRRWKDLNYQRLHLLGREGADDFSNQVEKVVANGRKDMGLLGEDLPHYEVDLLEYRAQYIQLVNKEKGEEAANNENKKLNHMRIALELTLEQVQVLFEAESLPEKSQERQEKLDSATKWGHGAREKLYMVWEDDYAEKGKEWVNERGQQELDKRILAHEQGVEIEFPEWLNKDIEESSEENLAEKSDEEKLRQTTERQADRLFPNATEDQRKKIIYDWMRNKKDDLFKIEEEWNEEVRIWTEDRQWWITGNTVEDVPDEEKKDEKIKEFALKKAYDAWTSPMVLETALIQGRWVDAIVRTLHIP